MTLKKIHFKCMEYIAIYILLNFIECNFNHHPGAKKCLYYQGKTHLDINEGFSILHIGAKFQT